MGHEVWEEPVFRLGRVVSLGSAAECNGIPYTNTNPNPNVRVSVHYHQWHEHCDTRDNRYRESLRRLRYEHRSAVPVYVV